MNESLHERESSWQSDVRYHVRSCTDISVHVVLGSYPTPLPGRLTNPPALPGRSLRRSAAFAGAACCSLAAPTSMVEGSWPCDGLGVWHVLAPPLHPPRVAFLLGMEWEGRKAGR